MRNAGLDEAQAGFNIARRNINKLRYADNTILTAESEEELGPFCGPESAAGIDVFGASHQFAEHTSHM